MEDIRKEGRTVLLVSHNMASILNLCPTSILLDQGKIIKTGASSEVVQRYVTSGYSAQAEIHWSDSDRAPGNEKVRFQSVRILNDEGLCSYEHDIQNDIVVEMRWRNLQQGAKLYTAMNLRDQNGTVVFGANNMPSACAHPDPLWNTPHVKGVYEVRCRIPGNLLNDGTYSIDAIVGTNVQHTEVMIEKVLSFRVFDSGAMSKEYGGSWHGVVRVRMDWSTKATSSS